MLVLEGRFKEGDRVVVGAANGELIFNMEPSPEETAAPARA